MVNSTTLQRVFYVTDLISGCMVSETWILPSSAIPALDQTSDQTKRTAARCIYNYPNNVPHSQLASHQ